MSHKSIGILTIPENVLASILFSGYFNSIFVVKNVLLVNKQFHSLGKRSIGALDLRALSITNDVLMKIVTHTSTNLMYIDLAYTAISNGFMHCFSRPSNANTLLGISLRGTDISNNSLIEISAFTQLRMLDLAKSKKDQSSQITDEGILALCKLTELEFLDISWTNISDKSISSICTSMPRLLHLGLQCCANITDQSFGSLKDIPLQTIDVSGCSNLSDYGFSHLINSRYSTHTYTYTIFYPLKKYFYNHIYTY